MTLEIRLSVTAAGAARDAAELVAQRAATAIEQKGSFVWAVSGGSTPARFLAELAGHDRVDWAAVHLFQVDERIAPPDSAERNDTMVRDRFVDQRPEVHYHPLPVEADDLESALVDHLSDLERLAGTPSRLDLVQLGLGTDGHTASLVPADPVLETTADLAVTRPYNGTRRVTMTAPLLNRAAERIFLVTGADKDIALGRLAEGDPGIPASLITHERTTVVTDRVVRGR